MRRVLAACAALLVSLPVPLHGQPSRAAERSGSGLGHVHMDLSCTPGVAPAFDRALALLHNFWYARALDAFTAVALADPRCAMAYWDAALTCNHPFWDPPSGADVAAARALHRVPRALEARGSGS